MIFRSGVLFFETASAKNFGVVPANAGTHNPWH